MAWDGARHQLVLFGGSSAQYGGTGFSDTWTWDRAHWTERHPAHQPLAGAYFSMTYDEAHRQLVLYGNLYAGCGHASTWTWDGVDWTEHPANGPQPGPRSTMAYDPAIGMVLLYGGSSCGGFYNAETWTWDGSAWKQLHPGGSTGPVNSVGGMAWDAGSRSMVYISGGAGESVGGSQGRSVGVWRYDGNVWSEVAPLGPAVPPGRGQAVIAPTGSKWLVFSGTAGNSVNALSDTWVWDGRAWTQQPVTTAPQPRAGAASAWDPDQGRAVIFGGVGGGYGGFILADTWTWDGSRWAMAG